jgi:LPS export ABC transporter protein LptC
LPALAVLLLLLAACGDKENIEIVDSADFGLEPDLVMTDFDYSASGENDRKNWDLHCRVAEKYDTLRRFLFKDVKFRLYEGSSVRAVLTSSYGTANYNDRNMTARSNVNLVFNDGTVLTTETLTWDDGRQVLRTEDFVRIVKPGGDTITGYGLTMDRNAEEIVIKRRVKGKFNNDGTSKFPGL